MADDKTLKSGAVDEQAERERRRRLLKILSGGTLVAGMGPLFSCNDSPSSPSADLSEFGSSSSSSTPED